MDHWIHGDSSIREQSNSIGKITIGEDCWIAANVTILKGSEIGNGAVVGAKSLVKGKVDPKSVVLGIPYKEIKKRTWFAEVHMGRKVVVALSYGLMLFVVLSTLFLTPYIICALSSVFTVF